MRGRLSTVSQGNTAGVLSYSKKKKKKDRTPLQGFTAYCVKKKSPYEPLSTDTPAITSSWVPLVLEERPKRHRKKRARQERQT